MLKRILSFTIAAIMLCVCTVCSYASVPYNAEFATDLVKELEIMVGDQYGNMNLSSNLTRAEFAKIAINASKYKNSVAHGAKISVFKDCTYTHWSAPYVKVAVTNSIITGYPDGTFKPDNNVTYEEALNVMLKLLGYTAEDFGNTWPYGQVSLATNIGLSENISGSIGEPITREDALKLVYNTLNAKTKGSDKEYASGLDAILYENVVIIATNSEDTSIAPGNVLTSAGTFKYSDTFDEAYIGTKGNLAVKASGDVICYTPGEQKNNKLVVYSILSDSVIVYDNGVLAELDISDNTTVYSGSDKLTYSSAKSQMSMGDVVYVVKNSSGSVEYLTLTQDSLRGPETLSAYNSNWYKAFTDNADTLNVIRNGEKVSPSELKTNDIIYYSEDLNTAFVYAKTVTGIYEKAIPNKDTPTSVVISGVEYEIESVAAFNKLSSSGSLSFGTSVTLLFGKDGGIADVVTSDSSSSGEVVGFLTETGKKSFENADGESYTSRYVTLVLPDGSKGEYTTTSDYSNYKNAVVKINFNNGIAKATKISAQSTLSGSVNYSNMTIGDYKVSKDVQILDVSTTRSDYGSNAVTTYMSRLDGVNLSNSAILWYSKNSSGEINKLILNDMTGDTSLYGIATSVPSTSSDSEGKSQGMSQTNGSYSFDAGGKSYSYSGGMHGAISLMTPVELAVSSSSSVETIAALKAVNGNVSSINGSIATAGSEDYKLSDKVLAYVKRGMGNYTLIPISELADSLEDYTVKAYYDKAEVYGGRIRILMAQPKF